MTTPAWMRWTACRIVRCGRELGWWLGGVGRLWLRDKARATIHVLLTAVAWWQQQFLLVTVLVVPVLAVAMWARVRPVAYRRWLADPLARWRFLRWLRCGWPRLMETVGLART